MDEVKPYNTELKINVKSDVTQEELAEYITDALEKAAEKDMIPEDIEQVILKPTSDKNILEMEIPEDAYTEDGDLKESYRKAYNTIIKENRRQNRELMKNAIQGLETMPKPKPVEIGDSTSFTMKYIIDNLIDNTGIIEGCTLTFKKTLTPVILATLSEYKHALTEEKIDWKIESYCNDFIKIRFENI